MNIDLFMGSENARRTLSAALSAGALSHGILLCAAPGQGANYLARLLRADITGGEVSRIEAGAHPLVQVIRGEGAQGLIRVDKIRRINENVNFSSLSGDRRAVIIQNCENFNSSSANALLKNLEEPKDDITYILTTDSPGRILPTIRSRCAVYTLTPPSAEQVRGYFAQRGADMAAVEKLYKVYGRNIGKISAALKSKDRYGVLAARIGVYNAAGQKDCYTAAKLCYPYNRDREKMKFLFSDILDICRNNMTEKNIRLINLCQKYAAMLSQNGNINLIIENFAVERAK